MIQQQTFLKVLDNSGAKIAKCIQILGGFKKKYAKSGDYIVVSIQQLKNKLKKVSKVKKKEVYKALVIKTKLQVLTKPGYAKAFSYNAIILLNKQNSPIGTRILTHLPIEIKKKKLQKIINLSFGLV
jgi:large subunit ribosomal protein L14